MTEQTQKADYLVIGAGAMGMAFTDVLMTETDATVVIVDRHHQPGGHWNDAYPFVRLHQPSAFYGVNSKHLGSDKIDQVGWNKGLYELATNSEVCAYFDQVMQQDFLPSGRVQYFPCCDYQGDGQFASLMSGEQYSVAAAKTVDATYMNVTVPSVTPVPFEVAPGAHVVPPNDLPRTAGQFSRYVVVGAGKTGMDACLFLLKAGVNPDSVRWIMPRDSWLLNRALIQPGEEFADAIGAAFAQQLSGIKDSTSVDDLFDRVSASGLLMPFDEDIRPTMYRCATVTLAELEQLRRIKGIVRMGRVKTIDADQIQLDEGSVKTDTSTLHVNCTADGLERRPVVPVFEGSHLTLQSVSTCQQVFSAAFIAHVEAAYDDDDVKNALCTVVPHPDKATDFLRTTLANMVNRLTWSQDAGLTAWLDNSRLAGLSGIAAPDLDSADAEEFIATGTAALEKLQAYVAEADAAEA